MQGGAKYAQWVETREVNIPPDWKTPPRFTDRTQNVRCPEEGLILPTSLLADGFLPKKVAVLLLSQRPPPCSRPFRASRRRRAVRGRDKIAPLPIYIFAI